MKKIKSEIQNLRKDISMLSEKLDMLYVEVDKLTQLIEKSDKVDKLSRNLDKLTDIVVKSQKANLDAFQLLHQSIQTSTMMWSSTLNYKFK